MGDSYWRMGRCFVPPEELLWLYVLIGNPTTDFLDPFPPCSHGDPDDGPIGSYMRAWDGINNIYARLVGALYKCPVALCTGFQPNGSYDYLEILLKRFIILFSPTDDQKPFYYPSRSLYIYLEFYQMCQSCCLPVCMCVSLYMSLHESMSDFMIISVRGLLSVDGLSVGRLACLRSVCGVSMVCQWSICIQRRKMWYLMLVRPSNSIGPSLLWSTRSLCLE